MANKSFGGYLGLELPQIKAFYADAIAVNSGRNGLEYILRSKQYKKIYIPYFTCDAVITPLKRLKIDYAFYKIDEKFEPIFDFEQLTQHEAFLYTNYLGLKSKFINDKLPRNYNVIIDNAQAFYARPVDGFDTFYSPRKFFGVPDGGYVRLDGLSTLKLEPSTSYSNVDHLLKQVDVSIEYGFVDYQENEQNIGAAPLRAMSSLTQKMLNAIDYAHVAKVRKENFETLSYELNAYNLFEDFDNSEAALHYPLYLESGATPLREALIKNRIYIPTYWPNVLEWLPEGKFIEREFVENIIHLPIDQRYGQEDMNYIAKAIKTLLS